MSSNPLAKREVFLVVLAFAAGERSTTLYSPSQFCENATKRTGLADKIRTLGVLTTVCAPAGHPIFGTGQVSLVKSRKRKALPGPVSEGYCGSQAFTFQTRDGGMHSRKSIKNLLQNVLPRKTLHFSLHLTPH